MTPVWPDRMSGDEEFAYVRHKPEQTLLYQLIERHGESNRSNLNAVLVFIPIVHAIDKFLRLFYDFVASL